MGGVTLFNAIITLLVTPFSLLLIETLKNNELMTVLTYHKMSHLTTLSGRRGI